MVIGEFKIGVIYHTFRKLSNNCLISEQCTFESLVPTVTTEPADASLDPAIRSVCGVCQHAFPAAD